FGERKELVARRGLGTVLTGHLRRDPQSHQPGAHRAALIAGFSRARGGLLRHFLSLADLTRKQERLAEIEPERDRWVVRRTERDRASEEVERSAHVVSPECTHPCAREETRCTNPE